MSKGALKQLPLIVACYVLLQHHDGAYRQTDAAEAGNRQWKRTYCLCLNSLMKK
jgi:hypothetical protein